MSKKVGYIKRMVKEAPAPILVSYKGGAGSGHWGHAGRVGKIGGSVAAGVALSLRTGKDRAERQAAAAGRKVAKKAKKLKQLSEEERMQKAVQMALSEEEMRSMERVIGEWSDANSLDYVVNAYEFTDPKTGIYTTVTGVAIYGPYNDKIKVYGQVKDKNGNNVGTFERVIRPDGEVHNEYFRLYDDKGKGFGRRFYQHQEEMNAAAGAKKVTIYANLDVGGYAWARMGYDFESESTRRYFGDNLYAAWMGMTGNESSTMRTKFQNMRSWEMAAFTLPGGERLGKTFMLGKNWDAVKYMDENDEGWKVGQVYYNQG